jgi:hypothetical protein
MRAARGIVCETRGGFHASFGRGDPCTQCKRIGTDAGCGTSSLLELFLVIALTSGTAGRIRN